MEAAPFLEELHIIFDGLPGLRRLSIAHNLDPRYVRCNELFLEYVTLPSLDALQFSYEFRDDSPVNFVKRSLPPLTYLSIDCENVREDAVIESLRLLPTLTEFRYHFWFTSADFFRGLTVTDRTHLTCPVLETLYLHRITSFEYQQTIKFIEGGRQKEYDVSALRGAFERHLLLRAEGISVSPVGETPHHPFAEI
ncbi:hypothetical protein ACEPAI_8778 [Sanghuangporus weigelae]